MACGDPGAAFKAVLLDPALTSTAPASTTAAAGMDALSHAVETWVTVRRTPLSEMLSREAFRLLAGNYVRVLARPGDEEARASMLLGSHWAGAAIEHSMLGATHACANPLTARYGTTHGDAIAILLPHVVRWNASVAESMYAELLRVSTIAPVATIAPSAPVAPSAPSAPSSLALAARLSQLASAGGLPRTLTDTGASSSDLEALAVEASEQWTGTFNPRPFDAKGALEIYQCAL